ncbi:DUF1266 domain-containing protein [Serratia sp. DD3]|uniref:DUF1266 domain-containing protein n=1 Tax=Serratia sp. DD3 TaxID=1410619 RepID=UPI0003C4EB6F|nr:DUF1266 domain-containing protein [Serratia sp. DD3]KEY60923.1 hypothetical protein SRDD_00970 [Serratia sp. DD3]
MLKYFILWVLIYFFFVFFRAAKKRWYEEPNHIDFFDDKLEPAWAHALLLAHPYAKERMEGIYYQSQTPGVADELLRKRWQNILYTYLDMRPSGNQENVTAAVTQQLYQRWYRLGLEPLHPNDDMRAALAFSCARVSFCVQLCFLLGWIDETCRKDILMYNGIRARDCFNNWEEYGTALLRGRTQWVAGGRSDSIGMALPETEVKTWLDNPKHPWSLTPWS